VVAAPGFDESRVLALAAGLELGSEHPLAAAIVAGARERKQGPATASEFESITGKGVKGRIDGKVVVLGNRALMDMAGAELGDMTTRAEQLRADGQTVMFLAVDGRLAGLVGVADPIKASTPEAIAALHAAGVRIALFGYAHLPSKLPHQQLVERAGRVLDRYERATLLLLAIEKLTGAGYLHLGLDHFARPGSRLARAAAERRMVRTFQGYVEHRADAILGIGVSAISSTPRMHWQSYSELPVWEQRVTAGQLPVERGFVLDDDDRLRRAVIGQLMCHGEVELRRVAADHGVDAASYFVREIAALGALDELASYDAAAGRLRTTPLGRLLVRNVCMVFDRYQREPASLPGVPGGAANGAANAASREAPRFSSTI
jgi:hypothetical protein